MTGRLFDESAFAGVDDGSRDDEVVSIEVRRRRWDPIADGFVVLARAHVGPLRTGSYGAAWHDVRFEVEGRKGEKGVGRRMFERFHVAGETKALKRLVANSRAYLARGMGCYDPLPAVPPTVPDLHGRVVPVRMTIRPRFGDGRLVQGCEIVSADPTSASYPDYLELCRRIGPQTSVMPGGEVVDRVPGWRLFPSSEAAAIMAKAIEREAKRRSEDPGELVLKAQTKRGSRGKASKEAKVVSTTRGALKAALAKPATEREAAEREQARIEAERRAAIPVPEPTPEERAALAEAQVDRVVARLRGASSRSKPILSVVELAEIKRRKELEKMIRADHLARRKIKATEGAARAAGAEMNG